MGAPAKQRLVRQGIALVCLATGTWLWAAPMTRSVPSRLPGERGSVVCGAPIAAIRKRPDDGFLMQGMGIIGLPEPHGIDPRCTRPAHVRVAAGGVLIVVAITLLWVVARSGVAGEELFDDGEGQGGSDPGSKDHTYD